MRRSARNRVGKRSVQFISNTRASWDVSPLIEEA